MILDEIREHLKKNHQAYLSDLTISNVNVGLYMTAVQLSDGSMGIASAECDEHIHCKKKDRDYGEFTPLQIQGRKLTDLLDSSKQTALVRTLQVAALNAVSSAIMKKAEYKILGNTDPVDLLDLGGEKTITIVGAFQSYIRRIVATKNQLHVLEFNEEALLPEHRQFFVPANDYARVLQISDIVIITGLTLVNNTLDHLLDSCRPDATIVVTGPSAGILPDVLFSHNVSILGATRITKPELVMPLIGQGAAGYHLFEYCAEKISIRRK
jgi:uncharacterized protein (DUF4213/DUF364 family)